MYITYMKKSQKFTIAKLKLMAEAVNKNTITPHRVMGKTMADSMNAHEKRLEKLLGVEPQRWKIGDTFYTFDINYQALVNSLKRTTNIYMAEKLLHTYEAEKI
jgi:hypothetical protein